MASPPQALYGEEETCAIIIPTKEVGAIIGRNGNYINKVKQYSHAQVRVVKGEDSGESRVEVRGSPDAQWRVSETNTNFCRSFLNCRINFFFVKKIFQIFLLFNF